MTQANDMTPEFRLVLCSCPDKNTAKALAEKALRAKLAACVNISAPSTSMYWWENHIHSDEEVTLAIKTKESHIVSLFALMQEAHPYEVPELIAIPISEGSSAYLAWLEKVTQEG